MELIDPYRFVRLVTMALASFWTLTALLRLLRFVRRLEVQLEEFGLPRSWLRRQMVIVVARSTVLDPLNLLLLFLLGGIWSVGWIVRGTGL